MDLVNSIFSQQWLWGAVVGAGLTYLGQWRAHCVQQNEEQHVAAMQIASGLRQWMALSERMIDDINSHGGSAHYEIPEFPFEKSLGQVSKLDRKMAMAVLELIHNKNDRNIEIEVAIECRRRPRGLPPSPPANPQPDPSGGGFAFLSLNYRVNGTS